ncbi:MAG: VTT domain-containing protein [Thermoguttaceae bacterium]
MRRLLPPICLITVVLLIPVVPFVFVGESLAARMESWLDETLPAPTVAGIVVGLLATDVFLPVPSSVVATFGGDRLGFVAGTAAAWLGMTLGAAFAFGLARLLGRRLASRLSNEEAMDRIDALSGRLGPMLLVLTRPVPVMAEAAVLFLGTTRMPWQRFVLPLVLSNLGIAAAYSALGDLVQLPIALAAAIALPLLAAAVARIMWPVKN